MHHNLGPALQKNERIYFDEAEISLDYLPSQSKAYLLRQPMLPVWYRLLQPFTYTHNYEITENTYAF